MSDPAPASPAAPAPRGQDWRSRHRNAAHASAHAQGDSPPQPVPDHPLVPQGHAQLITADADLQKLLDELRRSGSFAYDSEFIGETSYVPKLCLIQVATPQHIWLIDPLAGLELRGFWELLCDGSIQKIVHAGDQDIEPAVRLGFGRPQNFFDTQIAAGFAGLSYPVALTRLVQEVVGIRLGKGLTFTHWHQRPLTNMQMRYAADDVRYLPALHAVLSDKLQSLGHADWARQAFDAICEPTRYGFDADASVGRVRGAGSLGPGGMAVLRELVIWRNDAAREADLPPRSFLRDEVLLDLARRPPRAIDALDRVRGLGRSMQQQQGQQIVAATLRALAAPVADSGRPSIEPTPRQRFAADSLWAAAHALCAGRQIDPALITSRAEITDLYRAFDSGGIDAAAAADLAVLKTWRRAALGEDLLSLLAGKSQFALAWRGGSLSRG